MKAGSDFELTRREVLGALLAMPAMSRLGSVDGSEAFAAAQELEETPACSDGDDITPPQTPGPFFKPRSPERRSLIEPGMRGTRIVLEGHVRTTKCKPVPGALVDFWQADASGAYDNTGYTLRGHQFADIQGQYRLETIVPGLYPGRTRHFHVKVQAPGQDILTTQLYFPGEKQNAGDGIFKPALLLDVKQDAATKIGRYDFVLDLQ